MRVKHFIASIFTLATLCVNVTFSSVSFAQPQQEINVINSAGQRIGLWKITAAMAQLDDWPSPGAIVAEGHYFANMKDGVWNEYYPDGNLKAVITYKNGELHGKTLLYADNGNVVKEVEYENGVPQGLMLTYYPDGTVWTKTTWKKGRIDGPASTYYPNGKVCEEGTWEYNYWAGLYTLYSETGQVIRKETKPPTSATYMIK